MLAVAGVSFDDVVDLVSAWLDGERSVWFRVGDDPVTGLAYVVLTARTDSGRPLRVLARVIGPDLHILSATYRVGDRDLAEFENWEAHHD